MKILVVTAAIIKSDGKFLIAQRKKGLHQEMKWEFPGGKVEQGEDPEACLVRELKEELDITVEVGEIFKVVSHIYEDRQVIPACIDCQDWKWAAPEEMVKYDFAPADIPVVRKLLGL